jgi:3-hydroxybutyryl-CoA dehydrogenase
MSIERVGVVGAGQMGTGIAQVCLGADLAVVLSDVSDALLARAQAAIQKGLDILVRKEKLTAERRDRALAALTLTTRIEDLAPVDFAIEAATEASEVKLPIFRSLDRVVPAGRVLASNTSSLSITRIAAATSRPEQVIGMHFMNPPPLMELIEVVRGLQTSDATFQATLELARRLGKKPVPSGDSPGFVANRVLMPMINEAAYALMEGVARAEDIDAILTMGANHPMGPLALADLIGLDTCLAILEVLHQDLGDPKYRPCPLLRKHVEAGYLGKKAGRGFYSYPAGVPAAGASRPAGAKS